MISSYAMSTILVFLCHSTCPRASRYNVCRLSLVMCIANVLPLQSTDLPHHTNSSAPARRRPTRLATTPNPSSSARPLCISRDWHKDECAHRTSNVVNYVPILGIRALYINLDCTSAPILRMYLRLLLACAVDMSLTGRTPTQAEDAQSLQHSPCG